jgi:signal transduction histidine kinase
MHVGEDQVFLNIADEGRGFDTATVLARSYSREHFGLRGIQERVRAMGGDCEILSAPDAGSRIMIVLPLSGRGLHIA